ncbi:MAG: ABC transporter ATP-binding protein [Candidatus Dormibacteria bacterium]
MTALVASRRAPAAGSAAQPPSVVVSGAIRRYPGGRSVGPIDIDVRAGEVLALMGSNGAGKSTLLRLLASADRCDGGRVIWWGDPAPRRARRQMGYAADEPVEETTLSSRQATYFWCRQWVRDPHVARRLTSETLDSLGLGDRADEPVGTLSYGLRRRLALAQALAHRPALALFDEPSAGLDPDGAAVITAALRARAAAGLTTVVASNDPEFVAGVADRVAMLHQGRCLRVAPLPELLAEVPRRRIVELRVGEVAQGRSRAPATPGIGSITAGGVSDDRGPGWAQKALALAVTERLATLSGVVLLSADDGLVVAELEEDAALAPLVAAADSVGSGVRSLEVRRPDLRECFHALVRREGDRGEVDAPATLPARDSR